VPKCFIATTCDGFPWTLEGCNARHDGKWVPYESESDALAQIEVLKGQDDPMWARAQYKLVPARDRTVRPVRHNGKCKCGAKHTALLTPTGHQRAGANDTRYAWVSEKGAQVLGGRVHVAAPCVDCACGKRIYLRPVQGTYVAEKPCNAKCTGATGHVCECSCGGKNHGAGNCAH